MFMVVISGKASNLRYVQRIYFTSYNTRVFCHVSSLGGCIVLLLPENTSAIC